MHSPMMSVKTISLCQPDDKLRFKILVNRMFVGNLSNVKIAQTILVQTTVTSVSLSRQYISMNVRELRSPNAMSRF